MRNHCQLWRLTAFSVVLAVACSSNSSSSAASGAQDTTANALETSTSDTQDSLGAQVDAADTKASDTGSSLPVCKPHMNTGCPADQHCGYDDADKAACLANGAVAAGGACQGTTECAIGECTQSQNGTTVCSPYCISSANCPHNEDCVGIVGKPYKVCDMAAYTACTPFASKCPAGQGCYDQGGQFVCLQEGKGQHGDTCNASNDCISGYVCAGASANAPGLCRQVCHATGAPGCDDPTASCAKITSSYGYCGT